MPGGILWSWKLTQQWQMPSPPLRHCSQGCCLPGEVLSPQLSATKEMQKEVGRFPVLASVTWQPESARHGYSKIAQTPFLVCLPPPLSLPRLFQVACDSSGRVGAAVLPRDA